MIVSLISFVVIHSPKASAVARDHNNCIFSLNSLVGILARRCYCELAAPYSDAQLVLFYTTKAKIVVSLLFQSMHNRLHL